MRQLTRKSLANGILALVSMTALSISLAYSEQSKGLGSGTLGSVENQLKGAVLEARSKLGALEPWQEVLFQEEVVPHFQRFIKDYKALRPGEAGESELKGLKVEIDFESIRNFLAFSAPKTLNKINPTILVILKTDAACIKCFESSVPLRSLIRTRLERRGFIPFFLSQQELTPEVLDGNRDGWAALQKQKNSSGVLKLVWEPAHVDEVDTAHADEKHYSIQTSLLVNGMHLPDQLKDLMDTDSFEQTEGRALTDLFIDLGSKFETEKVAQSKSGNEEVLIEVSGIKDFTQYTRIKNQLIAQLKDLSPLEDRSFSKNQVVFAVFAKKEKNDELKKQVEQIQLDSKTDPSVVVSIH